MKKIALCALFDWAGAIKGLDLRYFFCTKACVAAPEGRARQLTQFSGSFLIQSRRCAMRLPTSSCSQGAEPRKACCKASFCQRCAAVASSGGGVWSGSDIGFVDREHEYIHCMFTTLIASAQNLLPSSCSVCHTWAQQAICIDCITAFAPAKNRCATCALP